MNVQVMSTIKGVGNKPLQHANSVTSLPSPAKLPKYHHRYHSQIKHLPLLSSPSQLLVFSLHLHVDLPRYGVVTPHEEELGLHLDNLARCTESPLTKSLTHQLTIRWGINVFKISELSNSRPLTAVAYTVFHERDLINQFKIPPTSLLALLLTLEEHYLTEVPYHDEKYRNTKVYFFKVPYHNSSHAADVTLSMNTLLNSPALESVFTPLEVIQLISMTESILISKLEFS